MNGRVHVRGGINYVTVILLLMVAAVAVGAWCYFPPYYGEYTLKRTAEAEMIRASEVTDDQIRSEMMKVAERVKAPLEGGGIQITRFSGKITVEYSYERPVPLDFLPPYRVEQKMTRDIQKVEHLFHQPSK